MATVRSCVRCEMPKSPDGGGGVVFGGGAAADISGPASRTYRRRRKRSGRSGCFGDFKNSRRRRRRRPYTSNVSTVRACATVKIIYTYRAAGARVCVCGKTLATIPEPARFFFFVFFYLGRAYSNCTYVYIYRVSRKERRI